MSGPLTRPGETHGPSAVARVQSADGSSPLTTKGDLYTFSTVEIRLPVGPDTYVLSVDLAEATGLKWIALAGGGDALVANPLSQFAATTSAQLRGVISDETGTGLLVFATSPTLTTPILGVASATSLALTGNILDVNGNELIEFTTVASAVNHINISNIETLGAPVLGAAGSDTNIGFVLKPKGTGAVVIGNADAGVDPELQFQGEDNNGRLIWMEDEDYFRFMDDVLINTSERVYFRDTSASLHSPSSGNVTGTGVFTFTSAILVTPALGTPASGVLTNCTGLPPSGLTTAAKTQSKMLYIESPTATDVIPICYVPDAATVTAIRSVTDTGTVTFNIEKRGKFTPGTSGTDILTADQVADATGEEELDASDMSEAISADNWLVFVATSIASSPTKLWVNLEYTVD